MDLKKIDSCPYYSITIHTKIISTFFLLILFVIVTLQDYWNTQAQK